MPKKTMPKKIDDWLPGTRPAFLVDLMRTQFESSPSMTNEYKKWVEKAGKWFKNWGEYRKIKDLRFNVGHFYISGFFQVGEQWWYFNIGDVRWMKSSMYVRKAKGPTDYQGERSQQISLLDLELWLDSFEQEVGVRKSKPDGEHYRIQSQ